MSGGISASGLITGIDSAALISQLMQLERQPIARYNQRIDALEAKQTAIRELRTQIQSFRNRTQDFRLTNIFNAFQSSTSEETVLTTEVNSSNPVVGAFNVEVLQLASATNATSSSRMGANVNTTIPLSGTTFSTAVESGTFTINGVEITLNADTTSLNSILSTITSSGAGVTASYDAVNDKVILANTTPGDTALINLGADDDTSNFLNAIGVEGATQLPNGSGSNEVTSTRNLGAVDSGAVLNDVSFVDGAITAGSFSINGVSITIDPANDSIQGIIETLNSSDAGIQASYDGASDGIRVISNQLGSPTIRFGGVGDTSNFLSVVNLDTATQTAGNNAELTVNGGPVLTRSTNEVSDVISGVNLKLLAAGTTTVTVGSDDDAILEDVQEFVDEFNATVTKIRELTGPEGPLAGDGTIRNLESFLFTQVFSQVTGIGDFESLLDIGITTGEDFDSSVGATLTLDGDILREALRDDRQNVEQLFHNNSESGVSDLLYPFIDEAAKATGFLNARAKANGSIDTQIQNLRDQIERVETRIGQKESRLRRQFTQLETLSAGFQNQSSALSILGRF